MYPKEDLRIGIYGFSGFFISLIILSVSPLIAQSNQTLPGCWPQEYTVQRDDSSGALTLSTPYYTVQHNFKKGGAITQIKYTHGKVENLLIKPIGTSMQNEKGIFFDDLNNPKAHVTYQKNSKTVIVIVDCELVNKQGQDSGIYLKSRYEYRWGYIKIRKEFHFLAKSIRIKELNVLSTVLDPSLQEYGYREGRTEQEGADPFTYGSCQWGKIASGASSDTSFKTNYIPRYLVFANPGIEGIEWFESSDLSQWDLQLTGQRGQGLCQVHFSHDPSGIAVSISPLHLEDRSIPFQGVYTFDYYIGMPILEGHAHKPWLHATFNRNRGNWVSDNKIKEWAQSGIISVHCHNDGDYYNDGLFWRDGSYPPYPAEDMQKYDKVIENCHRYGIQVATYFSNKELHPSTEEYKKHGSEWGRKDHQGNLRTNYFRANSPFGVQMCLKSGWLEFLKVSIDRVLKHHKLDGVYYDWNVGLHCTNPLHVEATKKTTSENKINSSLDSAPAGHWDIDELIELMEWTRQRVGPEGLIIVHNTRVPMFVTENFADYVVSMEWGYKKWLESAPQLQDLPLEWAFAGSRSRGVIGYGIIDPKAPRRMHKLLALESMLTGVTPWTASPEALELFKILKPLGEIEQYKFVDWRNNVVSLDNDHCASAIYSRAGETYIVLANLDKKPISISCQLNLRNLPYPLLALRSAILLNQDKSSSLDVGKLTRNSIKMDLPADGAVLLHIQ